MNNIDVNDINVGKVIHATDDITCGDSLNSPQHSLSKKIEKSVMSTLSSAEATDETYNFIYRDENNKIRVVDKSEGETSFVWKPISSIDEIISGQDYLLVNELYNCILDGSLADVTGSTNNKVVAIVDQTIEYNSTTLNSAFTITKINDEKYSIKSKLNGYYIGQNAKNKIIQIAAFPTSETEIVKYTHTITNADNYQKISTINPTFLAYFLQFNNSANKFAYYSSAQKVVKIYKKTEIQGKTTYEWRNLVKEGDIQTISQDWLNEHLVPSN